MTTFEPDAAEAELGQKATVLVGSNVLKNKRGHLLLTNDRILFTDQRSDPALAGGVGGALAGAFAEGLERMRTVKPPLLDLPRRNLPKRGELLRREPLRRIGIRTRIETEDRPEFVFVRFQVLFGVLRNRFENDEPTERLVGRSLRRDRSGVHSIASPANHSHQTARSRTSIRPWEAVEHVPGDVCRRPFYLTSFSQIVATRAVKTRFGSATRLRPLLGTGRRPALSMDRQDAGAVEDPR